MFINLKLGTMLKSYLTTALRHLLKSKLYSTLNVIGLSVGLACFTLIGLWVKYELTYDSFHKNADRIYRVADTFTDESGTFDQAVTPRALAAALLSDFPEVEEVVRVKKNDATVKYGDKQFLEDAIVLTDPSFFSMFGFRLLKGNPATALKDPYSVVLSESIAKKYFGTSDLLGQSIRIFAYDPDGKGSEYKITGIAEDCPSNTQFHYDILLSFATVDARNKNADPAAGWKLNSFYTFLMIRPDADAGSLEVKFPGMIDKYMGVNNKLANVSHKYFLQPLTTIHLGSHLRYELGPVSSPAYVMIFGTIGIIVLLLACINYVNLSTAVSSERFKEVGMRKVMGAGRRQLIPQYLAEAWLLAMGSLAMAFVWIELSRPAFESLTGNPVVDVYTTTTVVTVVMIASFAGLGSGFYPAFLLSTLRPLHILKGKVKAGSSGLWLRKGLVVLQYAITIILVIGIFVVQLQMNFIRHKDLGFSSDHLIVLGVHGSLEVQQGYDAFNNDMLTHPVVTAVVRSNSTLAGKLGNGLAEMEDPLGKRVNATVSSIRVDHDYADVYKMKLLAGRFFSKDISSDSTKGFVVNESTLKTFGYEDPADAIGKTFKYEGKEGQVIGVMKDFLYNSLQYQVAPTCMYLLNGGFSRITVRFNGTLQESASVVAEVWKKHFPESVMDFKFAEDALNSQYKSEDRFSKIFMIFSAISLAIACLGLFALVSYTVESRTKEIGVRKVLGASVPDILGMLSKEFLMLIIVSAGIGIPMGYYFMNSWLSSFAYQVKLNPLVFVGAGALVLMIAWITISLRSVRAATANPVDSLRNE